MLTVTRIAGAKLAAMVSRRGHSNGNGTGAVCGSLLSLLFLIVFSFWRLYLLALILVPSSCLNTEWEDDDISIDGIIEACLQQHVVVPLYYHVYQRILAHYTKCVWIGRLELR